MPQRSVWAQVTGEGEARTWHLEGLPGETRCGKPTQQMKNLPKADWGLVLRPCTECRGMRTYPWRPFKPATPRILRVPRPSNTSLQGTDVQSQTSRDAAKGS